MKRTTYTAAREDRAFAGVRIVRYWQEYTPAERARLSRQMGTHLTLAQLRQRQAVCDAQQTIAFRRYQQGGDLGAVLDSCEVLTCVLAAAVGVWLDRRRPGTPPPVAPTPRPACVLLPPTAAQLPLF